MSDKDRPKDTSNLSRTCLQHSSNRWSSCSDQCRQSSFTSPPTGAPRCAFTSTSSNFTLTSTASSCTCVAPSFADSRAAFSFARTCAGSSLARTCAASSLACTGAAASFVPHPSRLQLYFHLRRLW
ncbi:hypothetical protein TYRP_013659 [Tyrophagus putrescentiae]|nr:hypothetical protein TYRP_013659 [Tyrophagus putrescentiae]